MSNLKVNMSAVDEWKIHDPFKKASPTLIKRVNKELLKNKFLNSQNKIKILKESKALL